MRTILSHHEREREREREREYTWREMEGLFKEGWNGRKPVSVSVSVSW